jgi:hypothetical protein
MRQCVEAMIVDVGNLGARQYQSIRKDFFEPAYDRFIEGGYDALADLQAMPRRQWIARVLARVLGH